MLTPEQKARLNPTQLALAEKWDKERELGDSLIKKLLANLDNVDESQKIIEEIEQAIPTVCEHDRSIWSNCSECHVVEALLYPELCCKSCEDIFEPDQMDSAGSNLCVQCKHEQDNMN